LSVDQNISGADIVKIKNRDIRDFFFRDHHHVLRANGSEGDDIERTLMVSNVNTRLMFFDFRKTLLFQTNTEKFKRYSPKQSGGELIDTKISPTNEAHQKAKTKGNHHP